MRYITPPGIRPPFARYSYGVEIPAGSRILVCSGQLGITPQDPATYAASVLVLVLVAVGAAAVPARMAARADPISALRQD